MSKIKLLIFMSLVVALAAQAPVVALAQLPLYADPGGVPHYFGPFGNWAFSPLPTGPVTTVTIVDGGTGYITTPTVTINDAYLPGVSFTVPLTDITMAGSAVQSITVPAGGYGTGFTAPVVIIDPPPAPGTVAIADATIGGTLTGGMLKFIDPLPGLWDPRAGPAPAKSIPIAVPDIVTYPGSHYYEIALREFFESFHSSLPLTKMRGYVQINSGTNTYDAVTNPTGCIPPGQPLPNPSLHNCTAADNTVTPAEIRFLGPVIVAQGRVHGIEGTDPNNPTLGKPVPVRIKFINQLPVGAPDPNTGFRPGDLFLPTDETVMGSGLGPALPGTAGERYTQNRATIHLHGNSTVWISDGNVHQWITPAGETTSYPAGVSARNVPDMKDAAGNIICDADSVNAPLMPGNSGCQTFFYTNAQSARLQFYHDHAMGITRLNVYAGEAAGYVMTDAVEQDMINGTNVTGVNNLPSSTPLVFPQTNAKVLPGLGIPLVIQDRTFVDATTIWAQDPTWNSGTGPRDTTTGKVTGAVTGDLWYPHVYMTVQNPWDLTGTNAFGRWHYGPWFNPPVPECVNGLPVGCIEVGPVPNEHCLPAPGVDCSATPGEPPFRPGLPNPSIPGESFLDTQLVNGTVYPYLEVPAEPVRFRVLNASNDRFLNLQLYQAADKTTWTPGTGAAAPGTPTTVCAGGANPLDCTEVKMVPVSVAPANQYADTPSGIPDPLTAGPPWWLIGTEGGFMPKPVVVPQQPIGYNLDPAYFAFGIVNQHSLFLGSAERADVIVDFSGKAGQTFILYNDSPAPVPAGATPYDYYTGSPNQMDAGGAPTTQPGYGPNTRTIMQIRVVAPTGLTPDVTLANLEHVFKKGFNPDGTPNPAKRGVFEVSQDPIIIPQAEYNSAYNATFPSTAAAQYIQIAEMQKTFQPLGYDALINAWSLQPAVTLPLEMKAMHDEMGGVYDTLFGRMSGMLGLSNPLSPIHVLIPYGLASPPTDLVKGSLEATPIGVMPDGTQIWRIFHNGVDTHTIHTHLFHTQLINRVDQSGQIVGPPVDPIELGWKDTFRVNPLEITYLAMRPTIPTASQLPFEVPNSIRLIDPTLPLDATLIPPPPAGWFDPDGIRIPEILNHFVNFGWEYVWHCHILSHEEMDMMHSLVFAVPPKPPTLPTQPPFTVTGSAGNPTVNLFWQDNSINETHFTIVRATDSNFTQGLTTFNYVNPVTTVPNNVTFQDTTVARDALYWYKVSATNLVGDTQAYPGSLGFPTMTANSDPAVIQVTVGSPPAGPLAPTGLTASLVNPTLAAPPPRVSLTWTDNATNETGFVVERCTGAGCTNFAQIAAPGPRNNVGNVTYVDTTVMANNSYSYRVKAVNLGGSSAYSPTTPPDAPVTVVVPALPATPTGFTVAAVKAGGNNYTATLDWASATAPINFTIQRATNATFTTNLNTSTVAGNLTTTTQTVRRNTTYYYRIRANNTGGSSPWVNALPFPIRTGP